MQTILCKLYRPAASQPAMPVTACGDKNANSVPVKPENLRGALTDGSAGGAESCPLVFNFAWTFFFGLALVLAASSVKWKKMESALTFCKKGLCYAIQKKTLMLLSF